MNTAQRADRQPDTSTHTRLKGTTLNIARFIWIAFTLLVVGLFIAAVPFRLEELRTICGEDVCRMQQVNPEGAHALEELDLSLNTYAVLIAIGENAFMLAFVISGALIFWRRSNDWMAMFVSLSLVLFGTSIMMTIHALGVARPALAFPLLFLQMFAAGAVVVLFYIFPNGRFVPGWTRWLALSWITILFPVMSTLAGTSLGALIFLPWAGSGLAAQVYRYKRVSGPGERQQTKWVVFGFALFIIGIFFVSLPIIFLGSDISPQELPPASVVDIIYRMYYFPIFVLLPMSAMSVFIAISTLRYRLWDVDPILNRSLVYGGLTVVLGIVFVGAFFGLQNLLEAIIGSSQVALLTGVSAALIVAIYNPVRRRLRRFVDQRIYGIEVEYRTPPASQRVVVGDLTRTSIGKYTDLQPIGRGGMAEVYRTQHPTLNRTVAVKILPALLAQETEFRTRFQREAQVVAQLKHPNIVQMFDFGEFEDTVYMVMEYIGGQDLAYLIHSNGRLPLDQAHSILVDISSALDYAHEQDLVHRDIKPSNVMLEPVSAKGNESEYRAVLMDFGIARIVSGMSHLTLTGGMIGTIDYIAPEQIQGASNVDGRADIYSLGVLVYQMLTGKLPFKRNNNGATLMAHMMQPPPDPREIVPGLPTSTASSVMKAMSKKPEERFSTAGEMVSALIVEL